MVQRSIFFSAGTDTYILYLVLFQIGRMFRAWGVKSNTDRRDAFTCEALWVIAGMLIAQPYLEFTEKTPWKKKGLLSGSPLGENALLIPEVQGE